MWQLKNNYKHMKNTGLKIILGIISSILIMALLFYFFIFFNPFNIYESHTLKWIPIVIAIISLYVSGWINRDTKVILLPFLFLPFVIFNLFNYTYFPFILILISTGILILVVTRKHPPFAYSNFSWLAIVGIFVFFLFSQPLILEKEAFGYDDSGNLINVNVLWGSAEAETYKLPNHLLLDQNNNDFDMADFKGKTHFITFWATWCAPCIQDKPELEKLKKDFDNVTDVVFVDISFDNDPNRWLEYLENKNPNGFQLISKSQDETSRKLHFAGIPMHFIVDSEGNYKKYKSLTVARKVIENINKKY